MNTSTNLPHNEGKKQHFSLRLFCYLLSAVRNSGGAGCPSLLTMSIDRGYVMVMAVFLLRNFVEKLLNSNESKCILINRSHKYQCTKESDINQPVAIHK